jgi:hypothetical protein
MNPSESFHITPRVADDADVVAPLQVDGIEGDPVVIPQMLLDSFLRPYILQKLG